MNSANFRTCGIPEVMAAIRQVSGLNAESPSDLLKVLEGLANVRWSRIDDWEEMSDLSILESLVQFDSIAGEVCVIDEASYRDDRGAFRMEPDQLRDFAENHLKLFGQSLFNGDAFFFCPKNGRMTVFHHEGVWAAFEWHVN